MNRRRSRTRCGLAATSETRVTRNPPGPCEVPGPDDRQTTGSRRSMSPAKRRSAGDQGLVTGALAVGLAVALSGAKAAAQEMLDGFVALSWVGGVTALELNPDGSLSVTLATGRSFVVAPDQLRLLPSGELAVSAYVATFLEEELARGPVPSIEPPPEVALFPSAVAGIYGVAALPLGLVLSSVGGGSDERAATFRVLEQGGTLFFSGTASGPISVTVSELPGTGGGPISFSASELAGTGVLHAFFSRDGVPSSSAPIPLSSIRSAGSETIRLTADLAGISASSAEALFGITGLDLAGRSVSIRDTSATLATTQAAVRNQAHDIVATTRATVAEARILSASRNTGETRYDLEDAGGAVALAGTAADDAHNIFATGSVSVAQAAVLRAFLNTGTTSYSILDTAQNFLANSAPELLTTTGKYLVGGATVLGNDAGTLSVADVLRLRQMTTDDSWLYRIEDGARAVLTAASDVLQGAQRVTLSEDTVGPLTLLEHAALMARTTSRGWGYEIVDSAQALLPATPGQAPLAGADAVRVIGNDAGPLTLANHAALAARTTDDSWSYEIVDSVAALLAATPGQPPLAGADAVRVIGNDAGPLTLANHAALAARTTDDSWSYEIVDSAAALLAATPGQPPLAGADAVRVIGNDAGPLTVEGHAALAARTTDDSWSYDIMDSASAILAAPREVLSNARSIGVLGSEGADTFDFSTLDANISITPLGGNDTITLGPGANTVVFRLQNNGENTINAFQAGDGPGADILDFSALGAGLLLPRPSPDGKFQFFLRPDVELSQFDADGLLAGYLGGDFLSQVVGGGPGPGLRLKDDVDGVTGEAGEGLILLRAFSLNDRSFEIFRYIDTNPGPGISVNGERIALVNLTDTLQATELTLNNFVF
jgi:hypothetical protein